MRFLRFFVAFVGTHPGESKTRSAYGYPSQARDPKSDMEPWLFEKIVREVFPYAEWATLSCQYEPFMSAYFDEIIQLAEKSPCPLGMTTNATLLTERKSRMLLTHPTIKAVSISIDGACKETFERIRINARWDKFIANLEQFAALRQELDPDRVFRLQFNTVLMKSTIGELPELVKLCARLGATQLAAIRYVPINNQIDEQINDWEPYISTLICAKMLAHQYGIRLLLPLDDPRLRMADDSEEECSANCARIGQYSQFCEAPWSGIQIYPNGDVHPCLFYGKSFGNLKTSSFLEIWNSQPYRELRKSLATMNLHPPCVHCNPHGYDNIEKKGRINTP